MFDDYIHPARFHDRCEAGRLLATRLTRYEHREGIIVVGLPRGGVVVAAEVAREIDAPLDIEIVRKLGAPSQRELAIGAIAEGGIRVLNDEVVGALHIPAWQIDEIAAEQEEELDRRIALFRAVRPPLPMAGRTAIIVDDGLATGSTMLAAVRAIKARKPAWVVIAVPVAPFASCEKFRDEVDEVIALTVPPAFNAVGEFYDEFDQVSDQEVFELLRSSVTNEMVAAH